MGTQQATPAETDAMRRALEAAVGGPRHGPNPRVGCVLLTADGIELAVGHHRGAGTPHAEAAALASAKVSGQDVRGATAVVTLEPCTHTGRTPPCAQALLDADLARVVVAAADPNPQAAGGVELLRRYGVEVVEGVLAEESERLNRSWLHAVRHGRPFVTLKWASTLDGRAAAEDGTSRWITGEQARADVHRRRSDVDAVLVGTGTVRADDPALTVRTPDRADDAHQPLRVVLGLSGIAAGSRVLDDAAPTLHLATRDLDESLAELHRREVRHLLVEGGPTVAAAFLRAGLVDEVLTYLAPAVLGAGAAAVGDIGVRTMADITRLRTVDVQRHGEDVLIVSELVGPAPMVAEPRPGGTR